jgi:hypothetical protein
VTPNGIIYPRGKPGCAAEAAATLMCGELARWADRHSQALQGVVAFGRAKATSSLLRERKEFDHKKLRNFAAVGQIGRIVA